MDQGIAWSCWWGEIIDRAPQKSRHATAVTLMADALRSAFGPAVTIRAQLPFALDDDSEPRPDVAVVPGLLRDYRDPHPDRALLLCEVSDTTLAYDRGHKLRAYALAGVSEYWIPDLVGETLEVCHRPEGDGYAERRLMPADAQVFPQERPTQSLVVKDLLP